MTIAAEMCIDNLEFPEYENFLKGESENVLFLGKLPKSNNSRLQWLSELPLFSPEYTGVEVVHQPHIGVQPSG